MTNYQLIKREELVGFNFRSLRQDVVDKLIARISNGFNPARPLTVCAYDGKYLVVDGNHRLAALDKLGIKANIPVLLRDEDPYALAIECNEDEDTYAPLDLFDWLDVIHRLRDEGLTQEQIGHRIGWSRETIRNYVAIIDRLGTNILKVSITHQYGRVPSDGTVVPFLFTEGWFRDSGLYNLIPKYQQQLMERFISDKFNWNKDRVQREASIYKQWQTYSKIAEESLVNHTDIASVLEMIDNGAFRTEEQLRQKIADLNSSAQNKLICGDAITELQQLDNACIDMVITDPPYGIDYTSQRSKFNDHITSNGIINDDLATALTILDTTLNILTVKTKTDAHLYIFTSWKVYPAVSGIIAKYFTIRNLLVWDKGVHGAGDLEYAWGNQYELIVYATKGFRPLNHRACDILRIPKLASSKLIHPTQKPTDLLTELLKVSARTADTICDPFMGSGSTIKATKQFGNLYYIGIELDRNIFNKAESSIRKDTT